MWLEGDDLAVHLQERLDDGLEARVGGEQLRGALGAVAEAEVLAHGDALGGERPDEDVVDELLGRAGGELGAEGDDDQLLHAQRSYQLGLYGGRGEQLGSVVRGHHRHRVRIEGQHAVGAGDHATMAEVDPVEGAHGDLARTPGNVVEARDQHAALAYSAARASASSSAMRPGADQGSPRRGGGEDEATSKGPMAVRRSSSQ